MSINLTILVKCIIICLCAGLIGYRLGYTHKPKPVGLIEIEKEEDGEIMTTFKLQQGPDWIAQQDTILFKVYNPENLIPDTEPQQDEVEKSE